MASADFTHWSEELARCFCGRRWILASEAVAATTKRAEMLARFGAKDILCIGMVRGLGEEPREKGFRQHVTGGPDVSCMQASIRASDRIFAQPTPELRAIVDEFDPDGSARVIAAPFASAESFFGRPVFGAREASWRALEDKVVIDRVFEEAGVRVAPYRIVPARREALLEAAKEVDFGDGTVWAGDAREGFHGGAELTKWIRRESDVDDAMQVLGSSCDRVRVMPFLEGVPCSIHGWVFPDHLAAFRPCEMVVLRSERAPAFRFMSIATAWDPPADDRDEMRAIARRLAGHLRDRYGYRGSFSLDGVMTRDGFLPTEINPRCGAAMPSLLTGVTDLSIELLHFATIDRLPFDWRGQDFEERVVAHADANRSASVMYLACRRPDGETPIALVRDPHWRLASGSDGALPQSFPQSLPQSRGHYGCAAFGGMLRVGLHPTHYEIGCSVAPVVAELNDFLDREFALGVGPLKPARDVRR